MWWNSGTSMAKRGGKMLHNIFFSHGILRKGWKENKEKRRRGSCCQILLRIFHPLFSSTKEKKHTRAQGISKSVPSPFLNPSFHHLLHTLTHKPSSPRGCHVTDLKGGEFAFFLPLRLSTHMQIHVTASSPVCICAVL